MKKNLFLTGPIGSGKSTSIAAALGESVTKAGGFLTVRQKDDRGEAIAYHLQRPDGRDRQMIIDYSAQPYTMHMETFETLGVQLLTEARQYPFVVLDEIGGFEVLSDGFMSALMPLLESEIPCIGVVKGKAPATRMIQRLGLGDAYVQRAENLRSWMRGAPETTLYECGQFDPEGLRLAREWAAQYAK